MKTFIKNLLYRQIDTNETAIYDLKNENDSIILKIFRFPTEKIVDKFNISQFVFTGVHFSNEF